MGYRDVGTEAGTLIRDIAERTVRSVVVSAQMGKTLASGSPDGTVRLWDTETWELKQTRTGYMERGQKRGVQPGWQDACRCDGGRDGAVMGCQNG